MISFKGIVLTYISPIVYKAVKMKLLRWERDTANWYGAMLFSKQLHWNLIRFTIIFNSNHGVKSRNRWMQISEISNVHVRVEACIFIISSRPSGCDLKTGSDAIEQVRRLDMMNRHDSTRAWMFEISDVCVHRVRDCTQWILLKMIVVQWNCLLKSMAP